MARLTEKELREEYIKILKEERVFDIGMGTGLLLIGLAFLIYFGGWLKLVGFVFLIPSIFSIKRIIKIQKQIKDNK